MLFVFVNVTDIGVSNTCVREARSVEFSSILIAQQTGSVISCKQISGKHCNKLHFAL